MNGPKMNILNKKAKKTLTTSEIIRLQISIG